MKLEKIALWRETGLFADLSAKLNKFKDCLPNRRTKVAGISAWHAEHLSEMRSALTQVNCIFRRKHSMSMKLCCAFCVLRMRLSS